MFKIPILYLAYNRPNITKQTLKNIIKLNPYKLYISVDGPKKNSQDQSKVGDVRKTINKLKNLNKKMIVKKQINFKNLGCKKNNLKAINWFFKNESMGIIIEDDCLIDNHFLIFCKNMLERYKYNKKIFCISGSNFQKKKISKESYYYSKYNHCWGWATWRNRWKFNRSEINFWPKYKKSKQWNELHKNNIEREYWNKIFNNVYKNKIDSWAYPWTLSVWKNNGITVTPTSNMVKNIGFGKDSTHSIFSKEKVNYLNKSNFNKSIVYPKSIELNHKADEFVFENHFKGKNYIWPYRMIYLIKIFLSNPITFCHKIISILLNR